MPPDVAHFLALYRCGRFRGSSSGERAARRLIDAMAKAWPDLDGSAKRGFVAIAAKVAASPVSVDSFMDSCLQAED